jgi:hypothetical protein
MEQVIHSFVLSLIMFVFLSVFFLAEVENAKKYERSDANVDNKIEVINKNCSFKCDSNESNHCYKKWPLLTTDKTTKRIALSAKDSLLIDSGSTHTIRDNAEAPRNCTSDNCVSTNCASTSLSFLSQPEVPVCVDEYGTHFTDTKKFLKHADATGLNGIGFECCGDSFRCKEERYRCVKNVHVEASGCAHGDPDNCYVEVNTKKPTWATNTQKLTNRNDGFLCGIAPRDSQIRLYDTGSGGDNFEEGMDSFVTFESMIDDRSRYWFDYETLEYAKI